MRTLAFGTVICALLASPVLAEGFQRIEDERGFLSLVEDKELKRLGIRLKVTDDGRIMGKAFGRPVTGAWRWDSGYFCRDLEVGGDPLEFNCQLVQVSGRTMRFTSDRGEGIYADLKLD
ncbi:dihydrodipicolinate reductase [Silicimonas sp. MF1-12-2]|uniref:dihydrodipicolinate reductase n=1 Tax=Silicimonas sp. MF1-12-2 TaxID=3384793 RepID=UPI0039B45B66